MIDLADLRKTDPKEWRRLKLSLERRDTSVVGVVLFRSFCRWRVDEEDFENYLHSETSAFLGRANERKNRCWRSESIYGDVL